MKENDDIYDNSSNIAMFISNICLLVILGCIVMDININTAILFILPVTFLWIIGFSTHGLKDENIDAIS